MATVPTTQVFQVKVSGTNPEQIAAAANILVTTLIDQNESLQSGRFDSTAVGLNAQATQVEAEIEEFKIRLPH